MRKRCYQKNSTKFYLYGAQGITVCTSWLNSFTAFLADMGSKPTPQHTIDRYPNNDGNYEPDNCRWATPREQANNRRSNITLEYNGERKTLAEWVCQLGLGRNIIRRRLKKGWPIALALLSPTSARLLHKQKLVLQNFGPPPASVQSSIIASTASTSIFGFHVVGW